MIVTGQRFYTHQELRAYLEQQIPFDAVPAAPNVFYLFKSEEVRQRFLAGRYRRPLAVPQRRVSEILFEQNRDVLDPFMAVVTRLFDNSRWEVPSRLGLGPRSLRRTSAKQ